MRDNQIKHFAPFLPIPYGAGTDRLIFNWLVCTTLMLLLLWPVSSYGLQPTDADHIPHVNKKARDNFVVYIYAVKHKAFAIAPGGGWAWTENASSEAEARADALQRCQRHSEQKCVLYSVNDEIVFDTRAWPQLWRLDKSAKKASALTGVKRGNQFPNLRFHDQQGKPRSISKFKGKITLVHFWGSWCPPCMREMPVLQKLQTTLKQKYGDKVTLVLLQVREPFSTSQQWAKQNQIDQLPLYDSGVKGSDDADFRTVAGKTYPDRKLAAAFPASYVLDRQGRVLFSHKGPIADWNDYLAFFDDIVKHAGQ